MSGGRDDAHSHIASAAAIWVQHADEINSLPLAADNGQLRSGWRTRRSWRRSGLGYGAAANGCQISTWSRLLKEKVIRTAAHLLEASVEDIEAAGGRVFVGGTDRSLTFREIAKAAYSEMGRLPKGAREEL